MPSRSLVAWNTAGAKALNDIESAHRAVGGFGRGRRYATEQINHAYLVLLAGQFQRFCRDLHSEAIDHIANGIGVPPITREILRLNLARTRQLDAHNAQPASIGADFGRLGLDFWSAVDKRDRRSPGRRKSLERLNNWRNAIAHQDFRNPKLPKPLRLEDVRRLRRVCSSLARSFDAVVYGHLAAVVGKKPW
jgi:hypothetical protein